MAPTRASVCARGPPWSSVPSMSMRMSTTAQDRRPPRLPDSRSPSSVPRFGGWVKSGPSHGSASGRLRRSSPRRRSRPSRRCGPSATTRTTGEARPELGRERPRGRGQHRHGGRRRAEGRGRETGGALGPALQHVAAVPLARQPALTSLAWTRLPPGAALEAAHPVIAARASPGTAGTPSPSPPSDPRPPTRATPAPRACPPPSTRPAAAGSCSWSRRSTHRAPRCPTPPPGGRRCAAS